MGRPLKPGDAVLVLRGLHSGKVTTIRRYSNDMREVTLRYWARYGERPSGLFETSERAVDQSPTGYAWMPGNWLLPLHDPDKTAEYLAELNAPEREGQR